MSKDISKAYVRKMVQAEVIRVLNRWTAESDLDNLSIAESASYAINLWMSGESPEEYDESIRRDIKGYEDEVS